MNEDFVPFELAKKLKEKGFEEKCFAYYTSEYTLYTNKVVLCDDKYFEVAEIDYEECLRSYNTEEDRLLRAIVDAPTISQVLKWLREEEIIHVCISFSDNIGALWEYDVVFLDGVIYRGSNDGFVSYEQAALAGIEYCLDNLI